MDESIRAVEFMLGVTSRFPVFRLSHLPVVLSKSSSKSEV